MKPPPNELQLFVELDEFARRLAAGNPEAAEAIRRVAGLSVWKFLEQRYRCKTASPTKVVLFGVNKTLVTNDAGKIQLLFNLACCLTTGVASLPSRAEAKRGRDEILAKATDIEHDAETYGTLGDAEAERRLRAAAAVYRRAADRGSAAAATIGVQRKTRRTGARACCMVLSAACRSYFGHHRDKEVAAIANAALGRRNITQNTVVKWRNAVVKRRKRNRSVVAVKTPKNTALTVS